MAEINWSKIEKKVSAFSKTPTGKKMMSDKIKEYQKTGQKSANGGEVLTRQRISELAGELITTLKMTAASYDLAPSVIAHFGSLDYYVQENDDGSCDCFIYFTDDLSRESLETDYNQGDGIHNIIALFNNGYVASAPKYGWWNGHSPKGEAISRGLTGDESFAFVKGTQARPSLHFMQQAIQDFANKYKGTYPLSVMLNEDVYDGNYAGSLNGFISKL